MPSHELYLKGFWFLFVWYDRPDTQSSGTFIANCSSSLKLVTPQPPKLTRSLFGMLWDWPVDSFLVTGDWPSVYAKTPLHQPSHTHAHFKDCYAI